MVDIDSWQTQLAFYGYENQPYTNDVYENSLPRLVELFSKLNVQATFFVVGNHAKIEKNKSILKKISENHEIASHSMTHPKGFSQLGYKEKYSEIKDSKHLLEDITGKEVIGFRAPDYDIDEETIDILIENGYKYDSSVFPTYCAPIMKVAHFILSGMKRKSTMGREVLRFSPRFPYRPRQGSLHQKGKVNIWEIPLTVTPFIRLPFYGTSIMAFGEKYLNFIFGKIKNSALINYTIHAFEMSDRGKDMIDERLLKHPGIKRTFEEKSYLCEEVLRRISENFKIITAKEYIKGVNL